MGKNISVLRMNHMKWEFRTQLENDVISSNLNIIIVISLLIFKI